MGEGCRIGGGKADSQPAGYQGQGPMMERGATASRDSGKTNVSGAEMQAEVTLVRGKEGAGRSASLGWAVSHRNDKESMLPGF